MGVDWRLAAASRIKVLKQPQEPQVKPCGATGGCLQAGAARAVRKAMDKQVKGDGES